MNLDAFPPELVKFTRAKIESECHIGREVIEQSIQAQDTEQRLHNEHALKEKRSNAARERHGYDNVGGATMPIGEGGCLRVTRGLGAFSSELVEETRNRTREDYAAKERHEFDYLEGTMMLGSEGEHLQTTRRLAEFPSELVEKTRNMIREELRTQREEIDRAVEAQDTTQHLLSRQSLRERTSRPRDTKSRPRCATNKGVNLGLDENC